MLAPMHEFFDLSKECYDSYCYCPCNCHLKKIIENVYVLLINTENFVKKIQKNYKVIF